MHQQGAPSLCFLGQGHHCCVIDTLCELRLSLRTIDCRIGSPIDDDIRVMTIQGIRQGARVGNVTFAPAQSH
ncbi:hypothetical protein D3C85_1677770 [compost metagenome]